MAGVRRASTKSERLAQPQASARAARRRASRTRGVEPARECLSRVARILVHFGFSPQILSREFSDICRTLKEPSEECDPTRFAYFDKLTHLISYWHSDPEYLDRRGAPIPLPLSGAGPTLGALIKRVLPDEDLSSVAEALLQFEGIRRHNGLYVPVRRFLAFPKTTVGVYELNTLLRLLGTFDHNVTSPRASRILSRTAVNPSYPASLSRLFHRWVKTSADKWLQSADNYMELREGGNKRGPRVRLGLSIFAFEAPVSSETASSPRQPNQTGRKERTAEKGVPRRTRGPAAKRRSGEA